MTKKITNKVFIIYYPSQPEILAICSSTEKAKAFLQELDKKDKLDFEPDRYDIEPYELDKEILC